MPRNNLAFCMYGDFCWPPRSGNHDCEGRVRGVLVIRFVPDPRPSEAGYAAWLGWMPGAEINGATTTADLPAWRSELSDEYEYLSEIPNAWERFSKTESAGFWLQPRNNGTTPDDIAYFRGAFLLDMFAFGSEFDVAPRPRLRWPLVPRFAFRRDDGLESGLLLGGRKNNETQRDVFRLELGFPLPVQHRFREDGFETHRVLPMRATFATHGPQGVPPDECAGLELGAGSEDRLLELPSTKKRLGSFGLAPIRGHTAFAYTKNLPSNPGDVQRMLRQWWPLDPGEAPIEHYPGLGLRVNESAEYRFLRTPLGWNRATPENLSLDLREDGDPDDTRHTIRYRFRQQVGTTTFEDPSSDLHRSERAFMIRFADELGGWLEFGTLDEDEDAWFLLDFEMSWERGDESVGAFFKGAVDLDGQHGGAERNAALKPRIRCRILWDETPAMAGRASSNDVHPFGTLPSAVESMRTGRDSIDRVEGRLPTSFLPHLELHPPGDSGEASERSVRFALHAPALEAWYDQEGMLRWSRPQSPNTPLDRWRLTLEDEASQARLPPTLSGEGGLELRVRATFPSFGRRAQGSHPLRLKHDGRIHKNDARGFAFFQIEDPRWAAADAMPNAIAGDLGSLRFIGAADVLLDRSDDDPSGLIISRLDTRAPSVGSPGSGDALVGVDLRLFLAIGCVDPQTTDVPRRDREPLTPPLLIGQTKCTPIEGENAVAGHNLRTHAYVLGVSESMLSRNDRRLTADLMLLSGRSSDPTAYVLLSEEPFGLVRFNVEPLDTRSDDQNSTVAVYDGVTRVWEFRQVTDTYRYVLPAQAIGDGADKPRRQEIYDAPEYDLDRGDLPPYPTRNGLPIPDATYLVDYRLTPSTELWIHPSDVERGYFLPEWAVLEIFRQQGVFGLGAALAGFRGEFLYGLSVGVDPDGEIGPEANTRVAEIEALTGRVVERFALEHHNDPAMRSRWNEVRRALRRRPQRLELWTERPERARPFVPARFGAGVTFALRETALHRAPVRPPLRPSENGSGTTPASKGKGLDPRLAPENRPEHAPRIHPGGLPGGALWPLESWNFFDRVRADPESSGGTLENVALSPFGGDADQTATFLGGNVKIIAQTRSGLVQRQRVEIMGRVAALWCRAKHVVVYERTVNDSAQFAREPEGEPDHGAGRTRRPLLRKVSEFVELLEPIRSYPDMDGVSARTTGCLDSVRFNTLRINVDSAWSTEVGEVGWKIPLWNRYAARIRPQVYPRPDVCFVTVAEGEGSSPKVAQECQNPENIYFYAEATREPDTDLWSPVLSVDYADLPECGAMLRASENGIKDTVAGRRPALPRTQAGYGRFTFRLAPAEQKTRINAERGDKPIFAGLESITFMRATQDASIDSEIQNFIENASRTAAELVNIPSLGVWRSDGAGAPEFVGNGGPKPSVAYQLAWLRQAIAMKAEPNKERRKQAARAIVEAFHGPTKRAEQIKKLFGTPGPDTISEQWNRTKATYDAVRKDANKLEGRLGSIGSRCQDIVDEAAGGIRRKRRLIAEQVRGAKAKLERDLDDSGTKPPATKDELVEAVVELIMLEIRPALGRAHVDLGGLRAGVETIRAILRDVEADVQTSVARASERVDRSLASVDRAKPWSEKRLEKFGEQLKGQIASLVADARAAVDEARRRIAVEIDDTAQRVGPMAAAALAEIAESRLSALAGVNEQGKFVVQQIATRATVYLRKVHDSDRGSGAARDLERLLDKLEHRAKGKYQDQIDEVRRAIEIVKSKITASLNEIAHAEVKATETLDALNTLFREAAESANNVVGELNAVAEATDALANELVDEGYDEILAALRTLESAVSLSHERVDAFIDAAGTKIKDLAEAAERVADGASVRLDEVEAATIGLSDEAFEAVDDLVAGFIEELETLRGALGSANGDGPIADAIRDRVIRPALDHVLRSFSEADYAQFATATSEARAMILNALDDLAEEIEKALEDFSGALLQGTDALSTACGELTRSIDYLRRQAELSINQLRDEFSKRLREAFSDKDLEDLERLVEAWDDIEGLKKKFDKIEGNLRTIVNEASSTLENARVYADRLLDEVGNLGDGGISAAPSNVLRLLSAASSSPELALLRGNMDRIRTAYREFEDIIQSPNMKALFARLGDALKAVGLDIPFEELASDFLPDKEVLKDWDLRQMFPNFGGLNLDELFDGVRIPDKIGDAVRLSHDLDVKRGLAWVQADVDVPLPGRKKLFQIGPFTVLLRDSVMRAKVRLEASKDSERVQESGEAIIGTTVELEVGGQLIVALEKAKIRYTAEEGLDFDFDPRYIRLNNVFQFIQDTLGSIFPDKIGGLTIVKQSGIPVGVEHVFAMPPMSANFGTSGVTNLAIGNRFRLMAYPDFVLSDRFNLSRRNQPFIFSIFIIGGTGYIQADAEYRPFDKQLSVSVEAAAGGSAALAFAIGPVAGGVYITLSVALTYRKTIGKPGGGLSVSIVLVIGGHVSLWGIVDIYLTLALRMTYRSSGQIDADGDLQVEVRISRWFKLKFRTTVTYKLRDGQSSRQIRSGASLEEGPKLKRLTQKARQLENAKGRVLQ